MVLGVVAVVDQFLDTFGSTARSDKIGDGKIWVTPVERIVRIRTGELDADAL